MRPILLLQLLKIRTKEVLYEKYRTEKLLARRATRNISEDETRRLLEGELDRFEPSLPGTHLTRTLTDLGL